MDGPPTRGAALGDEARLRAGWPSYVYIYIYIEREREIDIYIYIYVPARSSEPKVLAAGAESSGRRRIFRCPRFRGPLIISLCVLIRPHLAKYVYK